MDPSKHKASEAVVNKTEDDLWFDLGLALGNNFGMTEDRSSIIESAKQWFDSKKESIRSSVCPKGKLLRSEVGKERVALIAAVADLISASGIGVAPFTVSGLVIVIGLDKFCKDFDR